MPGAYWEADNDQAVSTFSWALNHEFQLLFVITLTFTQAGCSLRAELASFKFENHVLGQLQSAFHVLRDSSSLHRLPVA